MIINGGSRCNAAWFTGHLTNATENERVTLCEIRNLAAATVAECFREMAAVASVTKCKNWFYHANINPRGNEILTDQQWQITVDLLEGNLGLAGHARFVVEHRKYGRTHRHVIWSRIEVERMRAVAMTNDYESHQITARTLERRFSLEPEESVFDRDRAKPRPARRPKNWEVFRGKQSGIDPLAMRQEITALKNAAKSGAEFAKALTAKGYILARGDKADFCIVDKVGDAHSLLRRITNARANELRRFMKGVNPASIPSVSQARAAVSRKKTASSPEA